MPVEGPPDVSERLTSEQHHRQGELMSLNIPYETLTGLKHLASGGMCHVWSGQLGHTKCVIKFPRKDKLKVASKDLDNELHLMQILDHPNICKLVGAGRTLDGLGFICMEELTGGTLSTYLGTGASTEGGLELMSRFVTRHFYMPMEDAFRHAQGVASAINYMHTEAMRGAVIMHRDLKSSNLGFDADGTLKLFDFGLAKVLRERDRQGSTDRYKLTGNTGSLRYMAPEVALSLPYNEKADVYSFSILLWELVSLRRPFDLYTTSDFRERVVTGGERPHLSSRWPEALQKLLSTCWAAEPSVRPSMGEVCNELAAIARNWDGKLRV